MRLVFYFALAACGSARTSSDPVLPPKPIVEARAARIDTPRVFRQADWQHWIDEDGDCQDTRQEVLIAESEIPVSFKSDRNCEVLSGQWTCPFTGKVVLDPSALTVTHLVPLAVAHAAGGEGWSAERRKNYANFVGAEAHLIAVDKKAEEKRVQQDPTLWLPAKNSCSYLLSWIEVSLEWGLDVKPEIFELHTSRCLSDSFVATCPKAFHNRPPPCADFSAMAGEWTGRGSQSSGSSWDVKLKIAGAKGSRCATIDYDKGSCGGFWTCKKDRQGRSFVARETLTYGRDNCVDDLAVQTILNDKNELVIHWEMSQETAEATLRRPKAAP